MKKFPNWRIFVSAAMILCSFAVIFSFIKLSEARVSKAVCVPCFETESESGIVPTALAPSSAVSRGYAVRSYEDTVCVFSRDGQLLWRTNIKVSKLRAVDAEALSRGIFVSDAEQVWQLLEDFGS